VCHRPKGSWLPALAEAGLPNAYALGECAAFRHVVSDIRAAKLGLPGEATLPIGSLSIGEALLKQSGLARSPFLASRGGAGASCRRIADGTRPPGVPGPPGTSP
jgi:hypothetical protein